MRQFTTNVNSLAVSPKGALYATGSFRTVEGDVVNNIAKWDGVSWSPPENNGGGLNREVRALASLDGNVYALDSATGAMRWFVETDGRVHASPAISGDVLIVGSVDGNIYGFNVLSGTPLWTYTSGAAVYASAAYHSRR